MMCYYYDMQKEELQNFFNNENKVFQLNCISDSLLNSFDENLLSLFDENTFSKEVYAVYKKFSSMDMDAPDKLKNELFDKVRNFAKEQIVQKKYVEALLLYRFLLVKSNLLADDYAEIGLLFSYCGLLDLAQEFMIVYKSVEVNKPLAFITLANFYNFQLKDYKTAIKYYEKYLQIDNTKSVVYTIVGSLYKKAYGNSSLKEQIYCYEMADRLKPDDRLITHLLAFSCESAGNKSKARMYYDRLMHLNPTEIDYYNYGAFLISCGEFVLGHKYFTHRFLVDDDNLRYPFELNPEKRWDLNSDISDKVLLVHYEQGFGDTFMYCRFIPALRNLAKKVIFVVQDSLVDLIRNSESISDGIDVVSDKQDLSCLKFDLHMALLDVPYVLKTSVDSIPYKDGYLTVSAQKVSEYGDKYIRNSNNLKVGISCCGDKTANYSGRDIPIEKFKMIANMPGIDCYFLQMDSDVNDDKIIPLGSSFSTFTETAMAVKNMDIVITTDNVILNLAGALGVKTIALYNKQTNYRWYKLDGKDVGWYKSVRPLQVDSQDNWDSVLFHLINMLTDYTKLK